MYRLFMALILTVAFNLTAYAEHPTAEHPSSEHPAVAAVEPVADDFSAASVKALEAKGMSTADAQAMVADILESAEEEGLTQEQISAKLNEVVNNLAKPEHPAAGSEHPSK